MLTAAVTDAVPGATATATLRRGDGGPARLLAAAADLHLAGAAPRWDRLLPPARLAALPRTRHGRRRWRWRGW